MVKKKGWKKGSEIKLAQSICIYMVDILHIFKEGHEKGWRKIGEARFLSVPQFNIYTDTLHIYKENLLTYDGRMSNTYNKELQFSVINASNNLYCPCAKRSL
jgi:hypothetical protein